tara:strand:+ start:905 stop:1180 length:276 start_codon:yes stop_codon:yes gene_type:complete
MTWGDAIRALPAVQPDAVSRDAVMQLLQEWTYCCDVEDVVRALPAVQPDAATLIRWHDMLMRDYPADLPSIVCAEMLALIDKPGKEVDDER